MHTSRTTVNSQPAVRAEIHMEKLFVYSPENNKCYPGNGIINITTLLRIGGVGSKFLKTLIKMIVEVFIGLLLLPPPLSGSSKKVSSLMPCILVLSAAAL